MTGKYLIGLDIGGGGGRCLLVNAESGEMTSIFLPWTLPPAPEVSGFAYKMDLENVWRVMGQATREAILRANVKPDDVAGIAATSMRHSTVVLNKKGEVLMAAPNRDARAAEQGMMLAIERGEELYRVSGHAPSPIFLAARLMWMKENRPEEYQTASAAVSLSDWLGYRLSGELASEPAQSAETLLLDLRTRKWSTEVIRSLGLSEKLLPPLKNAGSRLGKLTREAAENLGLKAGTPVAVGGPDTQCGLLGSGVTAAGQVGVVAGTTAPVQMVTNTALLDPAMHTWSGLHVIPGLYVLESNAGQMGSTLEWAAKLVHPQAPNPAGVFAAEAQDSAAGANGMLSTIGAAVFNAGAMEPPVDTLTFSGVMARPGEAGRADLARAVLEGMAYAVRANIEQILGVTGGKLGECRVTGGISRSGVWTGIMADVLNQPVLVSSTAEATALGAAICAGVGAGIFRDLQSGAMKLAQTSRRHEPGADAAAYQDLYAGWMELRQERRPADVVAINRFTDAMMSGLTEAGGAGGTAAAFRPKIYISAEVDDAALKKLGEIGEVTYKPYRTEGILLTGDDLVQTLKGYQVFVTEVDIVDAEALLKLPDLRMIVVCRGNPVNVDIEACTLASVPVTNTPARNADAVADLAAAFMLMQARKLAPAAAFLHQPGGEAGDMGRMGQAHEEFLGVELWRKTVGIIGGGAIGRKVTARLLPFGTRVLVYDPFISAEQAGSFGAEKVPLERLLGESDFISLHAAVTPETRGMINAAAFAKMKKGAYLVNTARAALVEQEALLSALRSEKLGGYAADVFPVEPPGADDPLLAFPNVIATPHMGGNTLEVAAHQGEIIATDLGLLLAGKKPKYLLNPPTMERFSWTEPRQTDEEKLRERKTAPGPDTTDLAVDAQKEKPAAAEKNATPAAASLPAEISGKVEPMDMTSARQKMIDILKEFTACIAKDPEFAAFAKGKNVVFNFTLRDMDQSFFMSFVDGKVDSGMGTPPREADVKLKMSADTLDGMFTGRVNATKAATSGKLSFSGDTGKAMSFIRIQGNMSRLYSEARQKIGDPGDLTKIGAAAATAAPAAAATIQPAMAATTIPAVAKTGDVRDQILQVTNELYAKGLITATGGNVSARCDDNPNEIWITPSAIFKGDLRPDMMVRIDLNGKIIGETDYSASSERRVHCAVYKLRPDITAVVHTHALQATLMAITGTHFVPISTEAAFIGDVPVVPFIMPGTDELGEKVAAAIGKTGIAALMQNHGLVVAGSTLRRAADMSEVVEVSAAKILQCKALGIQPAVLPDEIVKTLLEVGSMMA